MSKYIQSHYQYPVTFSAIGRTIPARGAQGEMKNVAEVSEAELEKLQAREPRFRELVAMKKYRILDRIPQDCKPASAQVNEAKAEAEEMREKNKGLESENAALRARLAELEKTEGKAEEKAADYDKMSYAELQSAAKERGIDPKQKKDALLAALLGGADGGKPEGNGAE